MRRANVAETQPSASAMYTFVTRAQRHPFENSASVLGGLLSQVFDPGVAVDCHDLLEVVFHCFPNANAAFRPGIVHAATAPSCEASLV